MEAKIIYRKSKNGIRIYSKSKVLSSYFKKWILCKLIEHYDLYEFINDGNRYLSSEIIEKSTQLSHNEISEYKALYRRENVSDLYFDEFLEIFKVVFGDIYVYKKNTNTDQESFINSRIAIIDLEDDGDWNSIWIEVSNKDLELFLVDLIEEYNCTFCN